MKEFLVTGKDARVQTGLVKLNDEQAARYGTFIERVDKRPGVYRVLRAIGFKRGETFSYEGDDEFVDVVPRLTDSTDGEFPMYKTLTATSFIGGRIKLGERLARRRVRSLKAVKGSPDLYEIVEPIQLKAGEIFGLDNTAPADVVTGHAVLGLKVGESAAKAPSGSVSLRV